ncbi:hypothetical protein BOTCAL_0400g00040 [Botryotinia calthae]|uniref:Cytochrome P450 n=1 Tax=Botryotinia calthae TaxID=38488 RepID=A0A4Y8CSX2_9HELO|nr:hypothetical protein BOTCAL_0400g00040 [Botryotinia calthae]
MAAQGTTYVLISNTLFLLSRNPELYKRLRDEVQNLDLEASSRFSSHIPCIPNHESHCSPRHNTAKRRWYKRRSPNFAPKVQRYTNQYALHRDETVFGIDVEIFNPNRWNSVNCKPSSWEYMPFGGGPRAYVGQQKTLVEAAYTVAKIAQVYKGLESRDDKD